MSDPTRPSGDRPRPRGSLTRRARGVRRAVLARRRLLAALLAAVAVTAGVRAVAAPPPALVPVRVAVSDLPAGAVVSGGDLATVGFAPGTVPDAVARDPVGRVLAAPVRRGEPVTDVRLVGAALTRGHPELVAVPVRLPDAAMVALLRAGDRIDLVAADPQGGAAEVVAREALVLAVPGSGGAAGATSGFSAGTDGLTGRLVVLGLSVTDVPRVSSAALVAFLTFAYSR